MKIVLPKDLTSTKTDLINVIEFNTFDVDLLLPILYYKILAEGRDRSRQVNDPTEIHRYIAALANHREVHGFNGHTGLRTLERLTRTALIRTGKRGEDRRKGEQIVTVHPYTLLAHKSGFPSENRYLRSVDKFLFTALAEKLGSPAEPRNFIVPLLGRGLQLNPVSEGLGGTYDGVTPLDTLTLLSIRFLDILQQGSPPRREQQSHVVSPSPILVNALADDLLSYLHTYAPLMPGTAFAEHLKGLINLELFVYSLRLVHATNALVRDPQHVPQAFGGNGAAMPLIYLDLVGAADGINRMMAKRLVQRDLETFQQYLSSSITIVLLQKYASRALNNPRQKSRLETLLPSERTGAAYLQALLLLNENDALASMIDVAAEQDEAAIRESSEEQATADSSSWDELQASITAGSRTQLERVVRLIVGVQQGKVAGKYIDWFSGTGGLHKAHGLLSGTKGHRSTWRYEPGNDLLAILVQLAAAHARQRGELHEGRLPLRGFLQFIEQRFGLLIDRPPPEFVGAVYNQAARENLRALQSRLRQMGIFSDLSDDFTVQHLQPPYLPAE
jgi:head-tail adaptor